LTFRESCHSDRHSILLAIKANYKFWCNLSPITSKVCPVPGQPLKNDNHLLRVLTLRSDSNLCFIFRCCVSSCKSVSIHYVKLPVIRTARSSDTFGFAVRCIMLSHSVLVCLIPSTKSDSSPNDIIGCFLNCTWPHLPEYMRADRAKCKSETDEISDWLNCTCLLTLDVISSVRLLLTRPWSTLSRPRALAALGRCEFSLMWRFKGEPPFQFRK
jgi:hypothetical protein